LNRSIEDLMVPSPDEKTRILKERARDLARAPEEAGGGEERLTVVEFMLAHERYALELAYIREVYPLKELTPLPGTPDFVMGIVNVRGQILSIIDIGRFFELPQKGLTNLNQVIILKSDDMEFGILADEILGTRSIPQSAIQPSLPTLTGIRAAYLKGVTGDRVVILDGAKILSDDKMVVQ
jgi:purine-binding chemotaxis protein CheW